MVWPHLSKRGSSMQFIPNHPDSRQQTVSKLKIATSTLVLNAAGRSQTNGTEMSAGSIKRLTKAFSASSSCLLNQCKHTQNSITEPDWFNASSLSDAWLKLYEWINRRPQD